MLITNPFSPGPCPEHYFSVNRPILAEEVPGALRKTNTLQGSLDVVSLKLCCDNYHEETFFQSFTVFKYVKIKLPGIRLQKCEPAWLSCAEPNFIFASPQNILLPIVKLVGTPIWFNMKHPSKVLILRSRLPTDGPQRSDQTMGSTASAVNQSPKCS